MARSDSWSARLDDLTASGLRRRRRTVRPLTDGWCAIDGRRVRNFASNDYLNLAHDPRVIAAAMESLGEAGIGATASALVCGRSVWHERLEQRLAEFETQPAALLFPTGMAANIGAVAALMGPDDCVFCDRFNHASLVDGCRLSGAKLRVYRHAELDRLEAALAQAAGFRNRWLVTDAVFSMDGDLAPLPELCGFAERFDAALIVDEAHGTGVFGERGRGVCEHFGVERRVAVRIGTLSKALGTLGGFVAGPQSLIDYLWNTARTQMFSTALPPALCAAADKAVEILQTTPALVASLRERCALFRDELAACGIAALPGSVGPIVPIIIGEPQRAIEVAARLEDRGLLVGAMRPPTVPRGTSRLRITVSLAHPVTALREAAKIVAEELQR